MDAPPLAGDDVQEEEFGGVGFLFDLVYDWIVHFVPRWLSWVLMAPLLALLILMLAYWLLAGGDAGVSGARTL